MAFFWYILDQAYTAIYDPTVKPISDWIDESEKASAERDQKQKRTRPTTT